MYKVSTIDELELVYSLLHEKNPNHQIDISYQKDTKKYILTLSKEKYKSDPQVPLSIDIQVVYGDTDSVFLKIHFNRKDFRLNRQDTFKLATICGHKLTDEIFNRPPIVLEFEKVFNPFVLLTKKRYVAQKYEDMKDPFKLKGIDAKGIALTRRDYCVLVKKCYHDVIQSIMNSENLIDSVNIFKSYIRKIESHDVDFDDLIVSAMLAKSYKTKPVHVVLAEKLKARNEEVQVGTRIPYIYIESDDPKKQKSELGEDPEYAKRNGLKFNRCCYLEQLAKPLLGFFKICLKEHPDLLDDTIDFVNEKMVSFGGKKLKPSEFKIEE